MLEGPALLIFALTTLTVGVGIALLVARRLHLLESTVSDLRTLAERGSQFDSPIRRLTFQESLDPHQFAAASEASATDGLNELLRNRAADGILITVHSVRLVQQNAEMIVSASSKGRQLLKEGKAVIPVHQVTGARLAQLTDTRTGRVLEQMKEIPFRKVGAKLATISAAAVGAAHFVAGADLAKRLGCVESKLDVLLATRRVDQIARLERIYISARELASQGMDRDRKMEMWRLRGELRELRSIWRQDLRLKLERIEDPANAIFFQKLFARQRSTDDRVRAGINEGVAEVALIEYAMRLEHVLAVGSDTLDEYQSSQDSELDQLAQLRDVLREKAGYISGKHPELSAQPMVDAASALVTAYREQYPRIDSRESLSVDTSGLADDDVDDDQSPA